MVQNKGLLGFCNRLKVLWLGQQQTSFSGSSDHKLFVIGFDNRCQQKVTKINIFKSIITGEASFACLRYIRLLIQRIYPVELLTGC